jgi:hypothetical protein
MIVRNFLFLHNDGSNYPMQETYCSSQWSAPALLVGLAPSLKFVWMWCYLFMVLKSIEIMFHQFVPRDISVNKGWYDKSNYYKANMTDRTSI